MRLAAAEVDVSKLPPAASRAVDFAKEIQPIFTASCLKCHGPEKQKGGYRVDVKAVALKGGDNYAPSIRPGKSADSPLIHFVAGLVEDMVMPQKGEPLTPEQIGLLRAWIDQGANWPDDGRTNELHWSLKPVTRPAIPATGARISSRNPIDAFVVAQLQKEKLTLSPEAGRRTLIRRLSFDLTGLPPTPEEVATFFADKKADAYEHLVEQLLASPRYGERWARHWLDVVRFAETTGFEVNTPRNNAWPYRDYVIRAFNEDKPYDQFVREQLAGDLFGEDAATGFLVGGANDQVKSPDIVLTRQQRADELHDMVATTGTAFLGLTIGCARCHNHKFDPIPQTDYYAVKAVFAGVQHGERRLQTPDYEERVKEAGRLRQLVTRIEGQLTQFEPLANPLATNLPARPAVHPRLNVERFAPVTAQRLRFTISETTGVEPCLDELEVYTIGEESQPPRNVALASAGTKATASSVYPNSVIHKLEHVNDGLVGNDHSWISSETSKGWVELAFPETVTISKVVWGRDREEKYKDRLATNYKIEVAWGTNDWQVVASSADRRKYVPGEVFKPTYQTTDPTEATRLKQLLAEQTQLEARIKELTAEPMVYAGNFTEPEETYRQHRGDPMQAREVITPGALGVIPVKFDLSATNALKLLPTNEQRRRLALANWIVDPNNPLTARVLVNRIWQHHFGQGLVDTPSDFGVNGAKPSHPELLDWLATEFVSRGWSIKSLHRLIVTSATYRQSGDKSAAGLARDAAAKWLWRFPPSRLEAEPIHDAILAVSGKLDLKAGGPGYSVFEPNDNYVRVYNPRQAFGPESWRRMIYMTKVRMQQDATFGAFDCPDAGQVAPKRTSSTTPLQALNLLNSDFMMQQAGFFAERLQRERSGDVSAQVRRAFELALNRAPDKKEAAAAVQFVKAQGLTLFCRALLNANEFIYVF